MIAATKRLHPLFSHRPRLAALIAALVALCAVMRAGAAPSPGVRPPGSTYGSTPPNESNARDRRLSWQWRRLGVVDYAATGALGLGYLTIALGTSQSTTPLWRGPVLLDRGAGNALIGTTPAARARADTVSDVAAAAPIVITAAESLLVPLLGDRGNTEVAWRLTVINVQSYLLNQVLTSTGKRLIRRERPDVRPCREDSDYSEQCFVSETTSMPSGHTSTAFVGAGVGCTHHLLLGLLGSPPLDAAACAVYAATATTAGTLRIVASRHYLSDVAAGAVVGTAAGVAMPLLMHYTPGLGDTRQRRPDAAWLVAPLTEADRGGLAVYGWF